MLLLGVRYGAAWRLRSWDRFYVPKPFSTVFVDAEVVTPGVHGGGEGAIKALQSRMLELNGETPVAASDHAPS
jgi:hypothetical protein